MEALSGAFGRLFDHATGAWQFGEHRAGSAFTWTYTFHGARLPLRLAAPLLWAPYMGAAADRCVARARQQLSPR